jgi:hypothetical protein
MGDAALRGGFVGIAFSIRPIFASYRGPRAVPYVALRGSPHLRYSADCKPASGPGFLALLRSRDCAFRQALAIACDLAGGGDP